MNMHGATSLAHFGDIEARVRLTATMTVRAGQSAQEAFDEHVRAETKRTERQWLRRALRHLGHE